MAVLHRISSSIDVLLFITFNSSLTVSAVYKKCTALQKLLLVCEVELNYLDMTIKSKKI